MVMEKFIMIMVLDFTVQKTKIWPKNGVSVRIKMVTQIDMKNSRAKLEKKHLDMIAANNLKTEGAGFGVATNVVTLITKDGIKELPLMGKDEVAGCLLDEIAARR